MASNKAATAIFIAAFAMIFAVEVAVAQDMRKLLHFHHLTHHAIRNPLGGVSIHHHHHFLHHHSKPPCADSVLHYKVNGFDFKMEKGHEACYIACYKSVFISESSPLTAEARCHKRCSSKTVSMFSASATATAKHAISSAATSTAAKKHAFSYTSTAAKKPSFSSTTTAAEKPAFLSSTTAPEKPAVSSTAATAEKPAVSSTNAAAEKPAVSSTGAAAEKPAVSSSDAAAEKPAVSSSDTEETNFANPYS